MTAPHTKMAILYTETPLSLNSPRETHTIANSVHRDNAFVHDTHENSRLSAQWFNLELNYSA